MAQAPVSTAPLNAGQLLNAAKAEASATTAGPLQQLAQQIASQNAQNANATKAIGGYFQGLGNYVNENMGQLNQVGSNLNSTLSQLSQNEQNQLQGISNNSAALMNQYLPKGDTSVGDAGMQSLIGNMAQQQGFATQNMGALQGAAATGQADYQDLAHALAGADATAGRQDLANVQLAGAAKIAPLATKYSALVDKQGQLAESDLVKLRQQEILNQQKSQANQINAQKVTDQNWFNQARIGILQGGNQIKSQQAATNAAKVQGQINYWKQQSKINSVKASGQLAYWQGMANAANTRANTAASEAPFINALRQAEANKANAAAKGLGAPKPLPQASNNVILGELGAAVQRAQLMQQQGDTPQQIQEGLTLGGPSTTPLTLKVNGKTQVLKTSTGQPRYTVSHSKGLGNPALVQAALELSQSGAISHDTWVQLHGMGIHNLPFKVAAPKGK